MMQHTTVRAPHSVQVRLLAEESNNHLKRLAYVLALIAVTLDVGSTLCPVMAVNNPYLASSRPMEGLTETLAAAATYYALEALDEETKSRTAMRQQLAKIGSTVPSHFIPEHLPGILNEAIFSVAHFAVKRSSDQRMVARPARASPAAPLPLVVWGSPSTGYYCGLSFGEPQKEVMQQQQQQCVCECVRTCALACVWSRDGGWVAAYVLLVCKHHNYEVTGCYLAAIGI